MKKKILIIGAGVLITGAAITTGTVVVLQKYKKDKETAKDPKLNDLIKKITANYENKEQIEPSKATTKNIKFSGIDTSEYKIIIKNKTVNNLNLDTIDITLRLIEIKTTKESDDTTVSIKGFKIPTKNPNENNKPVLPKEPNNTDLIPQNNPTSKPSAKTKEELNKIITNITLDFNEDKSKTTLAKWDSIILTSQNITNDLEVKVISKEVKNDDSTTLLAMFLIKEKTGEIESDLKTVEITGFKKPSEDIEELNNVIKQINPIFNGDKSKTDLSNPQSIDITYTGESKDLNVITINKSIKENDPTTLVVSFKLKSQKNNAESFTKTVEIQGFRKLFLTVEKLDEILKNTTAYFNGDKTKTDLLDLTKLDIKFKGHPNDIEVLTAGISVKSSEIPTLLVSFRVKEKDSKIQSSKKTVEISGFKNDQITNREFAALLYKIDVTFDGDKSTTDLSNPDKLNIKYSGGHDEVSIITIAKEVKPNNPTSLLVTFKLKLKAGRLETSARTVEISGFKKLPLTKMELDTLLKLITASYDGNKSETDLKNPEAIKINYKWYPENIDVITVQKTQKLGDPSTLVIHFKIKEKNGKIESNLKTFEISGFKQ